MRLLGAVLALGATAAGALGALQLQPRWLARLVATRHGFTVFAVRTGRPEVALTFDDGPAPESTTRLLEVLDRHQARATFFMIGSHALEHPDVVAQVAREGHELANHLWRDRPSVLAAARDFERDLLRTQQVLHDAGRERPVLVRPASGWFRPALLRVARRHGYRMTLGSITTRDIRLEAPARSLDLILRRCQPGGIIVLHDKHPSPEALVRFTDALLRALHAKGLRAVTVSQLLDGAGQS